MSRDEFLRYLKSGWEGYQIGALGTGLPFAMFLVLPWLFEFCRHTFSFIIDPVLLAAVWMGSCCFEAALGNVLRGKRMGEAIDIKTRPHGIWPVVMFAPFACLMFAGLEPAFHACRGLSAFFLAMGGTLFLAGFTGKWMEEKGVKL